MKTKKVILSLLAIALIWACGKDDETTPTTPTKNNVPVIAAKTFSVPENITPGTVIGTITATDADKDALTFSITANDNNLFAITKAGVLSLASVKSLDFATKAQHVITVAVSDGEASASAKVTINVTKVDPENLAPTIEAQQFEAIESISDTEVIGTVAATDPEDDTLGYAIAVNDNDLFEIDPLTGELSLAEGMKLDFGAAHEHTITIGVSDGNSVSTADVTIMVGEDPAPTGEAQEFNAMEDISDTHIIGTVDAEDPEGQPITFSIATNDSDLFEITESGELSLAPSMALDFETAEQHNLVIGVSDGWSTIEIPVTIMVGDVSDTTLADDPASFVTTWKTDVDGDKIVITYSANIYDFDFMVDWGDGTVEHLMSVDAFEGYMFLHQYEVAGTYTVAIMGEFPSRSFVFNDEHASKLMSIEQWGSIVWQDMSHAFRECENMVYNATDVPDLTNVTDMNNMFFGASKFNGDISDWDVSNVTDMSSMFENATSFNQPIGSWDVSSVTMMANMFDGDNDFNQDLSEWGDKVGSVTNMQYMFSGATSFNQDISGWDVSAVQNMEHMFSNASAFNQSLAAWNIGSVTNMSSMLNNSGMSPEALNATFIGWNNFVETNNGPNSITVGTDGMTVCGPEVFAALSNMTDPHGWLFIGLQFNANCN